MIFSVSALGKDRNLPTMIPFQLSAVVEVVIGKEETLQGWPHVEQVGPGFYLGFHIGGCKQVPGGPSLSLPSLPPLLSTPLLPLPPFRSRPPQIQLGGLGERCKLPQRDQRKSNWVHFNLKI